MRNLTAQEDALIALGRACSRWSADERALRRLELESPHCTDPRTGFPVDPIARQVALRLLNWAPEPLADL
jgi:hypothetical protein